MTLEDRLKQALRDLRWKSSNPWNTEPRHLMDHHVEQFTEQLLPLLHEVRQEAVEGRVD